MIPAGEATTEVVRDKLDEKLRKKKISKLKTSARRIAPVAILVPSVGALTNYAVTYVSAPSHLYPLLQTADAKAKAKQNLQTSKEINQLAQSINKSAEQLASISSQAQSNQNTINSISNGINGIKNTPIPTLGPLATPPSGTAAATQSRLQPSSSYSNKPTSAPTAAQSPPPRPIVSAAPPIQLPAATTRSSQIG